MFFATKGYVQLEVKLNSEIRITPMVKVMEFMNSAKAIAKSVSSILNYRLKDTPKENKEVAVKEYLEGKGWKVHN